MFDGAGDLKNDVRLKGGEQFVPFVIRLAKSRYRVLMSILASCIFFMDMYLDHRLMSFVKTCSSPF